MSPTLHENASGFQGLLFGPGGAAALAGMIEISVFHPFDTCSKRLMRHTKPVVVPGNRSATADNIKKVLFGGMKVNGVPYEDILRAQQQHLVSASASSVCTPPPRVPATAFAAYLYPGSVYAVYYKVSQRFIKFAGQPYVRDWMHRLAEKRQARKGYEQIDNLKKGNRNSGTVSTGAVHVVEESEAAAAAKLRAARRTKLFFEASAGSIVGMSEVILLPIDRMKVLSQTNAATIGGRSMVKIMADEGVRKMYAAAGTTMFRNCIGSFLLFGGSALTKEHVFGLEDYRKATVWQNLFSSAVGASLGVFTTSPMDVIKTRLQSRNLQQRGAGAGAAAATGAAEVTAFRVVTETLKTEGPQAFFKGITPKIITTAPKLIFSYTFTLYYTEKLRAFAATRAK